MKFLAARLKISRLILSLLIFSLLTACTRSNNSGPAPSPAEATQAPLTLTATAVAAIPTPTAEPLAASINNGGLSIIEYQAELALYQAAAGREPTPEEKQRVLNSLIDEVLLAQGAAEKGFNVDDSLLQTRRQKLANQLGGEQALQDWINSHGFTETSFRKALQRSIAAAWMRDQIASAMPASTEQVHARQILLYNSGEAEQILAQLKAGNSFENLAIQYDPLAGGDLGWFPRGYLPNPKIEEAAFGLQPKEFSAVIETPVGFHILQVLERDPNRPLDPEARRMLQIQAVQKWLEQKRSQSSIQILAP